MPSVMTIVDVLSIILQYGFILFIYYFIYKVVYLLYKDLNPNRIKNEEENSYAKLILIDLDDPTKEKQIFSFVDIITIGRNNENDIIINDQYVSHYHAQIKRIDSNYILEDLDSINHTYLNNESIVRNEVLKSGDIIKIGLVTFRFER
ncbi:FHA domain-containing protein [Anaerosinus massiliensis]|uniref:FHA domain-containing protein n=1 Tax=Massilibacillus massiliensis TaxID=1806837 RepID=UPI000DA63006|nr:FHA domain-containing protein [Massilibacillus massiliensis]